MLCTGVMIIFFNFLKSQYFMEAGVVSAKGVCLKRRWGLIGRFSKVYALAFNDKFLVCIARKDTNSRNVL